MAWLPISQTTPQYVDGNGDPYSGAVLKFYEDGTTTNTNMATDNTGGTQLASVALDSNGYPSNGGAVFIPHLDQTYKIALYPTQAAADSDTGAIWTIDDISPADQSNVSPDELAKVSSNDTTAGYLNGKLIAGPGVGFTENNDGSNETLTIAQDNPLTLGTEQATTSGTEIDFTSIPAGTKKIHVLFEAVSTSGTDHILIQIGDSGGIETSGYVARTMEFAITPAITTLSTTQGFIIYANLSGRNLQGQITLYLKKASSNTWLADGHFYNLPTANYIFSSGYKPLSAELDRVRITTSGGTDTFDGGLINILYS